MFSTNDEVVSFCDSKFAVAATASTTMDPANTNLLNLNNNNCNTISNIVITSSSQSSISSAMTATDGIAPASPSSLTTHNAQAIATSTAASIIASASAGSNNNNSNNCNQPRLHPKKRKFNPAEYEEMEPTAGGSGDTIQYDEKGSQQQQQLQDCSGGDGGGSSGSAFNATNNNNLLQRSNKNWWPQQQQQQHPSVVSSNSGQAGNSRNQFGSSSDLAQCQFGNSSRSSAGFEIVRSQSEISSELVQLSTQSVVRGANSSIIRMAGPLTTHTTMMTAVSAPSTVATTKAPSISTSDDALDLTEWCNHRVLAKQEDIYVAGIIRSVEESNTIWVEFDYPEGTRQSYYNVLGAGRFDVISDASPSAGDVIVGSRVCIRMQSNQPNRPGNVFVEGIVVEIHNETKQFVVQIANAIGGNDEFRTVKRGQIRLLRPPWWDELNDSDEFVSNPVVQTTSVMGDSSSNAFYGGGGDDSTMPNSRSTNHRLKYITSVEQRTPLQLHHVLPTLQVSFITLDRGDFQNFKLQFLSLIHLLA